MPNKKFVRRQVNYLTRPEVEALLASPDRHTWSGRRDHALLLVAVQTGLRCSELAGLRVENVELGRGPHLRCYGKGRKERCTPLRREAVALLRNWIRERGGQPTDPVFPNARGAHLSVAGIEYIVRKHVTVARTGCTSLRRKRVSPHCLRHALAMELLQSGVDRSVIALWLRSRVPRDYANLPGSRPCAQGKSAVSNRSVQDPTRTISAPGSVVGIPQEPVNVKSPGCTGRAGRQPERVPIILSPGHSNV